MNVLFSMDWDSIFGYVVHDYCFVSLMCVAVSLTLAFGVRVRVGQLRRGR